jgi:hypothetical protein
MREFLNKQVVNVVKNSIKQDENLVDVIMNTLSLGREAAYRRIRGEVPFSFCETVQLSQKFHFSLDSIAGVSLSDVAVVYTRFFNSSKLYEDYKQILESYLVLSKELNDSETSSVALAYILFLLCSTEDLKCFPSLDFIVGCIRWISLLPAFLFQK